MNRYIISSLISIVVTMLVSACGTPATDEARIPTYVAETAVARQSATAIIEQVLAAALTGSAPPPSATSTPTATAPPTETPTPSPTPNPTVEVIVGLAQIRGGPGIAYRVIQNASDGDTFEVIGRSENGRWLVVSLVLGEQGWIFIEQVQGLENAEVLVIVEAPPTPQTEFTITVVNNLNIGTIQFRIISVTNFYIGNGESRTFSLPLGTYEIVYEYLRIRVICRKKIFLDHDIYWAPTGSGEDLCDSFP